jgi:hypothetical protein
VSIRDDILAAIRQAMDAPYYPDPGLPPIHPNAYRDALDRLGLPPDHRLTQSEYVDSFVAPTERCRSRWPHHSTVEHCRRETGHPGAHTSPDSAWTWGTATWSSDE